MEKINIKIIKGLMYADVPFWSIVDNRYRKVFMLIDTGANTTSFAERVLKELGCFSNAKKSKARTAGGYVDIHEIQVPKVKIGSVELTNVDVHSHKNLDSFPFDGIIGMNVLSLFNFSVNFDDNIITFDGR
ncbi:MAG: retroviral-like aspartic protease family protein [Oscillospiraceae bacterium]|nr:retroviral-like aspartic protease family protein [Oscillospiraceae bacterium]